MWKRVWRLAVVAAVFVTVLCDAGHCLAADVYYFKMEDGKTYVGTVLPSGTDIFKVRLENGKVVDLPFDAVVETGEYSDAAGPVSEDSKNKGRAAGAGSGNGQSGTAVEIGLTYYHFDYKEEFPPPGKSEESGWLPGLYVGLSRVAPEKLYYKVFFEYASDDVDYDGGLQLSVSPYWIPYTSKSSATFLRFQFNIGYTLPVNDALSVSPYLGYGYRKWERGLRNPIPANDIDEIYDWQYVPVGVAAHYRLNDQWSIHPSFEARFVFQGSMTVQFKDPLYNEPSVTLGNKPGYKVDIPVRYCFREHWAVTGTPWYSDSEIGKSDYADLFYNGAYVTTIWEPASETKQFGFNLIFSYFFK